MQACSELMRLAASSPTGGLAEQKHRPVAHDREGTWQIQARFFWNELYLERASLPAPVTSHGGQPIRCLQDAFNVGQVAAPISAPIIKVPNPLRTHIGFVRLMPLHEARPESTGAWVSAKHMTADRCLAHPMSHATDNAKSHRQKTPANMHSTTEDL